MELDCAIQWEREKKTAPVLNRGRSQFVEAVLASSALGIAVCASNGSCGV